MANSSSTFSSPWSKYKSFILTNAAQITSIEQTAKSFSYFLPGRFKDADLASESLFALVNLISMYHDHVLNEAIKKTHIFNYKPSLLNQYHQFWQANSQVVKWSKISLAIVQNIESCCELLALKSTNKTRRYNVIVTIEAIKAILRLLIVVKTNQISITPTMPDREIDPESVASALVDTQSYCGPRSKIHFPTICALGDRNHCLWDNYLPSKAIRHSFASPKYILSQLTKTRSLGECLFILRPLIYAFMLRKDGTKSWRPLVSSFTIELVAYLLLTHNQKKLSSLEQAQLFSKRKYLFLWYLLRGPLYTKFTKPKLDTICRSVKNKPVLSLISTLIQNYRILWEDVYFYTSGS